MTQRMNRIRMKIDFDSVRIIDLDTNKINDLDEAMKQVKRKFGGGR